MTRPEIDTIEDVSLRLGQIKSSVVLFGGEVQTNPDLSEALFGVVAQLRDLAVRLDEVVDAALAALRPEGRAHG